jgi:hypothetical protein
MTGNDIKDKVERYTDMTLSEDKILDGINEAINWLGNMNYIIDVIAVSPEAKKEYDLPLDLIKILSIEDTEDDVYYENYLIDGNIIRFKVEGDYRIYAQRHPNKIDSISKELPLHPMLENCIITYVKGYIKLANDDENKIGWNYIEKFERDAQKAYQTLKRNQKTLTKVTVIRHA